MNRFTFLCYAIIYKILQSKNRRRNLWIDRPMAILAGDDIGLQISIFGQFESDVLKILATRFFPEIKQGVCFDIGANIGNHTRAFSPHFETVYAFEPNPATFELLRFNAQKFTNIETFPTALSNKKGTQAFSAEFTNSGKSKLTTQSDPSSENLIVNTITLDEFMASKNVEISFIKLDVEGHEPEVLQGAERCITTYKPLIMLELLEEQIENGSSFSLQFLRKCGYSEFWYIEQNALWSRKLIQLSRRWGLFLIIQTFLILIFGQFKPRLVKLNPYNLSQMNYDAIIAR